MVQLELATSASLAEIQQGLASTYSVSRKFNLNLTRRTLNVLSNDGLNVPNFFGTDYVINQPAVQKFNKLSDDNSVKYPIKIPINEWEGIVVKISNDSFIAKLKNVKSKSRLARESGKFKLYMLSSEDQSELQLESILRWSINLEILPSGQRQNVSKIILLDTPEISAEVIENAYIKADEMTKRLEEFESSTSRSNPNSHI